MPEYSSDLKCVTFKNSQIRNGHRVSGLIYVIVLYIGISRRNIPLEKFGKMINGARVRTIKRHR